MDQLNKNRITVLGLLVVFLLIALSSSQSIAKIKFEESILPILKSNASNVMEVKRLNEVDFSKSQHKKRPIQNSNLGDRHRGD